MTHNSFLRSVLFYYVVHYLVLLSSHWASGVPKGMKEVSSSMDLSTEDFKTLVFNGIFVDKSLFINETLKSDDVVIQITRPRKWGKTINLNMLKRFFEIELDKNGNQLPEEKKLNPNLFRGGRVSLNKKSTTLKPLKISGIDDVMGHMGKHPVIYVNLKDIKGKNYTQYEERMKNLVTQLFLSFPFLKDFMEDDSEDLNLEEKIRLANFITGKATSEDFICSFEFLSMLLHKHFKTEVCIFIDDYDYPIINAFLEFGDKNREFDSIVIMLRVLFENAFKENQYLLKGIITGTLNFLVVASGISEYHYVGFNTVLDKEFSQSYGFMQKDIGELMGKSTVMFNPQELRKWYGGYHINGEEIFNPGSVMKCLAKHGKYDYYMQKSYMTDFTKMIDKAFLMEDAQDYFNLLIEGKKIVRSTFGESVHLRSVSGDFYSVLVHAGYLERQAPPQPSERPIWRMRIPNMDAKGIFASGMGKWVAEELELDDAGWEIFINLFLSKQCQKFGEDLEKLLTLKELDGGTPERYYHNLVSGIVCSQAMKYEVESIKEYGKNQGGCILIPYERYSNTAIQIEYRVCKSVISLPKVVDVALKDVSNTTRTFSYKLTDYNYIKRKMNLAIVFCGPKVITKHSIINL